MTSPLFDIPQPVSSQSIADQEPRPERLRFTSFAFKRAPSGYSSCEVVLEWRDHERYVGSSEGMSSPFVDLRLAAEATIRALAQYVNGAFTMELLGVKTLRAFDANVVIVSVLMRHDGKEHRLLGCHVADEDSARGAVLATLQATNRKLGLAMRSP